MNFHLHTLFYLSIKAFRHMNHQLHGHNLLYRKYRIPGIIHIAVIVITGRNDTVDRTDKLGILFQIFIRSASHIELGLLGIEELFRRSSHLIQGQLTIVFELDIIELGF